MKNKHQCSLEYFSFNPKLSISLASLSAKSITGSIKTASFDLTSASKYE